MTHEDWLDDFDHSLPKGVSWIKRERLTKQIALLFPETVLIADPGDILVTKSDGGVILIERESQKVKFERWKRQMDVLKIDFNE